MRSDQRRVVASKCHKSSSGVGGERLPGLPRRGPPKTKKPRPSGAAPTATPRRVGVAYLALEASGANSDFFARRGLDDVGELAFVLSGL